MVEVDTEPLLVLDKLGRPIEGLTKFATYKTHYLCARCKIWVPQRYYKNIQTIHRCPACNVQVRRSPRKKRHETNRGDI